jgi:hypothetical protein
MPVNYLINSEIIEYFKFSFLVENDEEWIKDKLVLVEELKNIWMSESYHTRIMKVQYSYYTI